MWTGDWSSDVCSSDLPSRVRISHPPGVVAEDARFELARGCPQHAFQACALGQLGESSADENTRPRVVAAPSLTDLGRWTPPILTKRALSAAAISPVSSRSAQDGRRDRRRTGGWTAGGR